MTLWWALSAGLPKSTSIHSDSMCALRMSEGDWQFQCGDKLAVTCRCLFQTAEELGILHWDCIHHVKGHDGAVWNELADCLAKHAVKQKTNLLFAQDIGSWVRSGDISQLWLLAAACWQPTLWPMHTGANMRDVDVVFGQDPIQVCHASLQPGADTGFFAFFRQQVALCANALCQCADPC